MSDLNPAELYIDWCPVCQKQVQAKGGSHVVNGGAWLSKPVSHKTERIKVVPVQPLPILEERQP